MKRNWFEIKYDAKTDCEYILKVYDECTKNHKEVDQPVKSNFMPENKTDSALSKATSCMFPIYIQKMSTFGNSQIPILKTLTQTYGTLEVILEKIHCSLLSLIYVKNWDIQDLH